MRRSVACSPLYQHPANAEELANKMRERRDALGARQLAPGQQATVVEMERHIEALGMQVEAR